MTIAEVSVYPEISVQPEKFLFDYKMLIFFLIIMTVSIILACKKKTWKKAMLALLVSDVIFTIIYVLERVYTANRWGYRYFIATNGYFGELFSYLCGIVSLFLIIFLIEKVVERFKGGK